jgi:ubiquinone/menaquinone biosynthesis C-methylase UbiE
VNKDDIAFTNTIASNYDRFLVPMLFEPYAQDLVPRLAWLRKGNVLETACGTGAVTQALRTGLSTEVSIVATDLNPDMLEIASKRVPSGVTFQQADAQELPFKDNSFDAVVCQFGVMFFPDKALGFREALRVLRPGGAFFFNVWDTLEKNKLSFTFARGVEEALPEIAPCFISRVPFSCGDYEPLLAMLREHGFDDVTVDTVAKTSEAPSLSDVVSGLGEGSPLRAELFAKSEADGRRALDTAAHAIDLRYGRGNIAAPMSAHVISAKKPM